MIYEQEVAKRHYDAYLKEYKLHQLHVVGWLYKGEEYTDCPCIPCYYYRRNESNKEE